MMQTINESKKTLKAFLSFFDLIVKACAYIFKFQESFQEEKYLQR